MGEREIRRRGKGGKVGKGEKGRENRIQKRGKKEGRNERKNKVRRMTLCILFPLPLPTIINSWFPEP